MGVIQNITYEDFRQIQRVAGVGSWKYDAINDEIFWSEEVYNIYGIDPQNFQRTFENLLKFIHSGDREKLKNAVEKCLLGNPYQLEYRIKRSDGSVRYVVTNGEPVFNNEGKVIGIFGTLQDITRNKMLELELSSSIKVLSQAQKLANFGSWEYDIISNRNYWSEETYKIYGIKDRSAVSTNEGFLKFVHPDDIEIIKKIAEDPPIGPFDTQFRIIRADGKVRNVYQRLEYEFAKNGEPVYLYGTIQDITERVEMENRLAYMSTHDELTDLPNHIFLKKYLKKQCNNSRFNGRKFAFMIIYIDGLENIRYILGYEIARTLIKNISERLKSICKKNNLLSYYSENHFALIINEEMENDGYEKIAQRVIKSLKNPFLIENYELEITSNISISLFNGEEESDETLIQHALATLNRVRKEGKNRYKLYSTNFDIQNYKDFLLRKDLKNSVKNEELSVYYHPMIKLKTNEIIAAEALIRWEHPEWGLISPMEFISLAEETGVIVEIGYWILREVCKNYKMWISKGMNPIKVSVNFSSIQFMENDFTENIIHIIKEYDLPPHFLVMEITESILMQKPDKAASDIKKLQREGIQIALDDFGTGFSSLAYLSDYNIDILKIDGAFVKKLPADKSSGAIIKSVINLCGELDIKLVAEGIENWDQLQFLKNLNCHTGQGYIYGKPVPVEEFEKILYRKKQKPVIVSGNVLKPMEERRAFFRVNFHNLLETQMTIMNVKGKKINVGYTAVLIKNIGPGGLCFISNVKLPVQRDFILYFVTDILNKKLRVYGCPVWMEERKDGLFEYGIEFTFDEKYRTLIVKELSQLQIKMKNDVLFSEGSFTTISPKSYFKRIN